MMKQFVLICALLSSGFTLSLSQNTIRLMIVTSERKVPSQGFWNMFIEMDGISYSAIMQVEANEWIESGKADVFDLLLFYDLNDSITNGQKEAYWNLLEKGKPMLFMHHALVSYQNWKDFKKIIGGKYYRNHPQRGPSTFKHNVEMTIYPSKKAHLITEGIEAFTLVDETYGNCEILPSVSPLLETDTKGNMPYVAWIHKVKNSEVVYIQNGHADKAFKDINFKKVVFQTIKYLCDK